MIYIYIAIAGFIVGVVGGYLIWNHIHGDLFNPH